jgi:CarD-like protein
VVSGNGGEMRNLAVGDVVVYGAHGAGTVETRETRRVNGDEHAVVVVVLAGSLSVQLPLALARKQLRSLVDEAGIRNDREGVTGVAVDQRRLVAEAVPRGAGEAWRRNRPGGGHPRRQRSRRRFHARVWLTAGFERTRARARARALLTAEIALARDVPIGDAEAWVDRQLAPTR